MVDIVVSVASKVAEYLVAPVGRLCGYMIFPDRYVRELNEEVQNLERATQRVQHSIDEAQRYRKLIEADVKKWMEDAENATKTARPAQAHGPTLPSVDEMGIPPITARLGCSVEGGGNGEAKKTCFCGWLPNLKERYRLGREAKRTVKDIRELIARGQFQKVDFENDPPGLVGRATDLKSLVGDTVTDSRASLFQGIMKALDYEKLKMIGVYGDGGVGKTTLLKEVEQKLRKEGKPFHMIAKSTVSNTPDLKKIQDDIAYAFGVNMKNEQSEVGRRDLLSKTLKGDPKKKVLIILDDLWDKLDLEAVGIPSEDESTKCKLLLASRDGSVLQQMGADETFRLVGLSSEEALRLFEKTCGNKLKDDEGFRAKADQVVAKLAGLPLLIKSVASTLKYGDGDTWDNALIKIEDPNTKPIVEWSYGRLESDEIKYLFLLCGFVGGSIGVELLLGLGMGLSLFKGFDMTIRSSRSKLNEMLRRLRSICLLQDGGDDKENVTIHDLYSEVVVSTPLMGQNFLMTHRNAGSWTKEKLEKCWVCLVNVGSDRLAELTLRWFHDSKIYMLSEHDDEGDCDRLDFTSMKELRVLYLRSMHFTSFRSSDEILQNLQSLYLDHCDVEDVAILGELKALQILSFARSSISSLPKEIGKLTKLKLLNLSGCWMLQKIETGVFKGLINLEELYMRESFDRWMDEDEISLESCNAKLAELKSLTNLTALEISITDPNVLLKDGDLPFGDLIRFWINIGDVEKREFEGLTSMMLNLEAGDGILSKEWVQKTLQKTQYLHLDGLREFKKSAHELCSQGFSKLKHLEIRNCSSIKHIVSSSNGALLILESLFLENLINLDKISDTSECFSQLKVIKVKKCDRLEYLWCLSQMRRLAQLEKIAVRECDSIRAIAIDNARKDKVIADNRVELPNLRCLKLAGLPKMTSFCIKAGITSDGSPIQVWFPRLESLMMVGLLDLEKILYGQPPLECSCLKSIEIRESKSRSSILKSDWILKLQNLESSEIISSPSAEAVFDLEELKVTGHVEILSRLVTLELSELPNLRRMLKLDAQLQGISVFRNLKELKVIDTGLTFLFPVSVAQCLREITEIEVRNCKNMEALVVDEDGRDEGTNDIIEFTLLKQLYIINCPMEKFLSYSHGKKEAITFTSDSDSQDAYSDSFFDQKVNLTSLEYIWLTIVGSFKRIWPHELPQSSFANLVYLCISCCSELLNVFPSSITITGRLQNLRIVEIDNCPALESAFECGSHDSNTEQIRVLLPNLASVSIRFCPSLESVFDCGSLDSNARHKMVSLPKLEGLEVRSAGVLRHVVKSNSQLVLGFPSLKRVSVDCCFGLTYLFPYGTATTLEKLECLHISNCKQMKKVVAKEEGDRLMAGVLSFPFLTNLIIFRCPNFGAFIPNPTSIERPSSKMVKENDESRQPLFNEMVAFPTLRKVRIRGIQVKELWSNQIHGDSFCELRSLELMDCDNLQRIAPSHVWKRLQRCLQILEVKSCRSIEIIYESDGMVVETGQLRKLVLHYLKNLRHIWRYDSLPNINIPFPNLEKIEVLRCPRLKMLFETFTASFLGQIKWLEVESCDDMELIADHGECEGVTCTTITFSKLSKLKLANLPKFRRYLPEKYHVEFPSLAHLVRVDCEKEPDQYDPPFLAPRAQIPLLRGIRINSWFCLRCS